MNEITIGNKVYISAKRASEITGYARDYVGQLCREGHVDAKMVGRSWYVYEPSIRAHRFGTEGVAAAEAEAEEEEESVVPASMDFEEGKPDVEDEGTIATWDSPVYKAESVETIPEMQPRAEREEVLVEPKAALTDMQTAWKEWFERKQQLEPSDAVEEATRIEEMEEDISEEGEEKDGGNEVEEDMEEDAEPIAIHRVHSVQPPVHREMDVIAPVPLIHAAEPVREPVPSFHMPAPAPAAVQHTTPSGHPEARIVRERIIRKGGKSRSYMPMTALLIALCLIVLAITAIGTGFAAKYVKAFSGGNPVINFLVGTSQFERE